MEMASSVMTDEGSLLGLTLTWSNVISLSQGSSPKMHFTDEMQSSKELKQKICNYINNNNNISV